MFSLTSTTSSLIECITFFSCDHHSTYVASLTTLVSQFLAPLRKEIAAKTIKITESDVFSIFSNIESIADLHTG